MATEDLSRSTFDPRKHYASVHMQQGRVIVDDDWNENEQIENEDRRRGLVDIVGPAGSPDAGFRIKPGSLQPNPLDFTIEAGTFYLGGLRLETEEQTYTAQDDWLQGPADPGAASPAASRADLVYLEAWQSPVSAVEDNELFEKALGGPDTSTRIRTFQRVHLLPLHSAEPDCIEAWQELLKGLPGKLSAEGELVPDVELTVTFKPGGTPGDLCSPQVQDGYLGAENQAIRVQLVDSTHLTWGFDNAAPLYRIQVAADRLTITLPSDPKDQAHWPTAGQVAEVLPLGAELPNKEILAELTGDLSKVAASYNPKTRQLKLDTAVPAAKVEGSYYFMRIWDRGSDQASAAAIAFQEGQPVDLGHTGLQVTISGSQRNAGDYWIIAARPETPNRVVPWDLESGRRPHGVRRFFAPLGVIQWTFQAGVFDSAEPYDCRRTFRPLTRQKTCCTFLVGDGLTSHGDFDSLDEALKHLPKQGGRICLLPGTHSASVRIEGRQNVVISGCGWQTIVHPSTLAPIFGIRNSQRIQLEDMTLLATTGTAIRVNDQQGEPSGGIVVLNNSIVAAHMAIAITVLDTADDNLIQIAGNRIAMLDGEKGLAAILSFADGVLIERNRIVVVPAPDPGNPRDPRAPRGPSGHYFDPCTEPEEHYRSRRLMWEFIGETIGYVVAPFSTTTAYQTQGGIQIVNGSERVTIRDNVIVGGSGHGITLGYVPHLGLSASGLYVSKGLLIAGQLPDAVLEEFAAFFEQLSGPTVYDIAIEANTIQAMGLSGIGVAAYFDPAKLKLMFHVQDLVVYRNRIVGCVQQMPAADQIPDGMLPNIAFGGIALASCEHATIQENYIEDNGVSHLEPLCGTHILFGLHVDISNNQVLNNGPRPAPEVDDTHARPGWRGGVVVANAYKPPSGFGRAQATDRFASPLLDGIPAVKVHDNIIVQPLGQALCIVAYGPVSVVGNCLTSQGNDGHVNLLSRLAGTVLIVDLGVSKDLAAALILSGVHNLPQMAQPVYYPQTHRAVPGLAQWGVAMAFLPSGNVLFASNQVTLDLRALEIDWVLSSILIGSLDDIAFHGNQSECASAVDAAIADTAIVGVTIRTNDNRFQEGLTLTTISLFSWGFMNMATGNQATHCLHVFGLPALRVRENNKVLYDQPCAAQDKRLGVYLAELAAQYLPG